MASHTNDRTRSIAVTLRPSGGVKQKHERLLLAWLNKFAAQWEFYEEAVNDDPATRHFHGRVLFDDYKRMDKIKDCLIKNMDLIKAEKKVLQKGIKWLYDDWEYAGKDGNLWHSRLLDEEDWEYADPDNKTIRKKNAQVNHYIQLLQADLPPCVTWQEIKNRCMLFWATDVEEMPGTESSRKELCIRIASIWNYRCEHAQMIEESENTEDL